MPTPTNPRPIASAYCDFSAPSSLFLAGSRPSCESLSVGAYFATIPLGMGLPTVENADRQNAKQQDSDHAGNGPLGRAGFHGDEWPLRREHDAEDHQHQRATDINQQLRRPDEIGAQQKENGRRSTQREQKPGRRAHDVLSTPPRRLRTRRSLRLCTRTKTASDLQGFRPSRYYPPTYVGRLA